LISPATQPEAPGGVLGDDMGRFPNWSDSLSSMDRTRFAYWPHGTIVFVD
jgi:hypothetical protein